MGSGSGLAYLWMEWRVCEKVSGRVMHYFARVGLFRREVEGQLSSVRKWAGCVLRERGLWFGTYVFEVSAAIVGGCRGSCESWLSDVIWRLGGYGTASGWVQKAAMRRVNSIVMNWLNIN